MHGKSYSSWLAPYAMLDFGASQEEWLLPFCFPLFQTDRSEISGNTQAKCNDIFWLSNANGSDNSYRENNGQGEVGTV